MALAKASSIVIVPHRGEQVVLVSQEMVALNAIVDLVWLQAFDDFLLLPLCPDYLNLLTVWEERLARWSEPRASPEHCLDQLVVVASAIREELEAVSKHCKRLECLCLHVCAEDGLASGLCQRALRNREELLRSDKAIELIKALIVKLALGHS